MKEAVVVAKMEHQVQMKRRKKISHRSIDRLSGINRQFSYLFYIKEGIIINIFWLKEVTFYLFACVSVILPNSRQLAIFCLLSLLSFGMEINSWRYILH